MFRPGIWYQSWCSYQEVHLWRLSVRDYEIYRLRFGVPRRHHFVLWDVKGLIRLGADVDLAEGVGEVVEGVVPV